MLLVRDEYTGVSTSNRDFLTKNIGLYFRFSSFLNIAALTKASDIAR